MSLLKNSCLKSLSGQSACACDLRKVTEIYVGGTRDSGRRTGMRHGYGENLLFRALAHGRRKQSAQLANWRNSQNSSIQLVGPRCGNLILALERTTSAQLGGAYLNLDITIHDPVYSPPDVLPNILNRHQSRHLRARATRGSRDLYTIQPSFRSGDSWVRYDIIGFGRFGKSTRCNRNPASHSHILSANHCSAHQGHPVVHIGHTQDVTWLTSVIRRQLY
jgi:hypothetical protein